MKTIIEVKSRFVGAAAMLVLALLQGCATAPGGSVADGGNPADPFEPFNRTVFAFNDKLDQTVIKPVATVYRDVTPKLVRTGVTNFFGNLGDMWSFVNNALQAKPADATDTFFRVAVNTLWGFGGVLDIASEMQIPRHSENFGQTLGYWGVNSGPYVVLPLFGPSTVRDSFGTVVDLQGNPVSAFSNVPTRNSLTTLRLVNARSNFLGAGNVLEQAALDKYTFSREIYLQRQNSLSGRDQPDQKEERFDLPETPAPGSVDSPLPKPQPQ